MRRVNLRVSMTAAAVIVLVVATAAGQANEALSVGLPAPALTVETAGGSIRTLDHYRLRAGEATLVLFFWASWSDSALIEMGHLEALYRRFRDRGLMVVGINVDGRGLTAKKRLALMRFPSERGVTYPIAFDPDLATLWAYGVVSVPSTVVLRGVDGRIALTMEGYPSLGREALFDALEKMLTSGEPTELEAPREPRLRAWAKYVQARNLMRERQITEALGALGEALSADPGFALPQLLRSRIYFERGAFDDGLVAVEAALEAEPDNLAALTLKAALLVEKGRIDESRPLLDAVLAANDTYAPALILHAHLLKSRGAFEEAFEAFGRAEGLNRLDYRLYLLRGSTLESLGRLREATQQYRQALALLAGYSLEETALPR